MRKVWVLKTCGSLVARQPWRSALEDLELSPIILKASIKLVWTHWCRLSARRVAERDRRKHLILSTCHSLCQYTSALFLCRWRLNHWELLDFAKFSIKIYKRYVKLHILGWKPLVMYVSSISVPLRSWPWLMIHGCLSTEHRHLKPYISDGLTAAYKHKVKWFFCGKNLTFAFRLRSPCIWCSFKASWEERHRSLLWPFKVGKEGNEGKLKRMETEREREIEVLLFC